MRIATWNMDHWRRTAELRDQAWSFLVDRIRPDVALLQESVPRGSGESVVFRDGGISDERATPPKNLGWGSSIVSFGPRIRALESVVGVYSSVELPLHRVFPGCVAIAEVGEDEESLIVASAYGVIDRGYADTTVHRILSDLTPLIDKRQSRRMIIAGDLNVTTQWSVKHRGFLKGRYEECLRRDRNVFDRFRVLGFENVVRSVSEPLEGCGCTEGDECRHVQTQRHDRSSFPWQNDYVFVTADLLERGIRLEVLDEEAAWRLSGHCPVIVEFEVEAERTPQTSSPLERN